MVGWNVGRRELRESKHGTRVRVEISRQRTLGTRNIQLGKILSIPTFDQTPLVVGK